MTKVKDLPEERYETPHAKRPKERFGETVQEQAQRILNAVDDGEDVPTAEIMWALKILGDA